MLRFWQRRRERKAAFERSEIPVLQCSGATKQGSRANNQDNFRLGSLVGMTEPVGPFCASGAMLLDQTQVFCVCDGIGGGARGELASWMALRSIQQCFEQLCVEEYDLQELVQEAAEAAHSGVLEMYRRMGDAGGCTLTMIALRGTRYEFLNIGDSPAFYYDRVRRQVRELSCRHNRAWESIAKGEKPEARSHQRLIHYLGREGFMASEMAHSCGGELRCGDGFLLCSDGVAEAFTPAGLKRAMKRQRNADVLTDKAARLENADNCTAICLTVGR